MMSADSLAERYLNDLNERIDMTGFWINVMVISIFTVLSVICFHVVIAEERKKGDLTTKDVVDIAMMSAIPGLNFFLIGLSIECWLQGKIPAGKVRYKKVL